METDDGFYARRFMVNFFTYALNLNVGIKEILGDRVKFALDIYDITLDGEFSDEGYITIYLDSMIKSELHSEITHTPAFYNIVRSIMDKKGLKDISVVLSSSTPHIRGHIKSIGGEEIMEALRIIYSALSTTINELIAVRQEDISSALITKYLT